MSVLIKGMEMPKSCFYCPFREKINPDDYVCLALNREFEETFTLIAGKRHRSCPLVPVPDHGRLIDAYALSEMLEKYKKEYALKAKEDIVLLHKAWGLFEAELMAESLPTIIPADKEVDG